MSEELNDNEALIPARSTEELKAAEARVSFANKLGPPGKILDLAIEIRDKLADWADSHKLILTLSVLGFLSALMVLFIFAYIIPPNCSSLEFESEEEAQVYQDMISHVEYSVRHDISLCDGTEIPENVRALHQRLGPFKFEFRIPICTLLKQPLPTDEQLSKGEELDARMRNAVEGYSYALDILDGIESGDIDLSQYSHLGAMWAQGDTSHMTELGKSRLALWREAVEEFQERGISDERLVPIYILSIIADAYLLSREEEVTDPDALQVQILSSVDTVIGLLNEQDVDQ
ncbi:hypothetical protein HOG48_00065 [Candidatus Peregrinibacteria bacterium]|jgi:hypothetical protein|nr:hypothetical protein [Candidatus Peregrinibacteria bacterium]